MSSPNFSHSSESMPQTFERDNSEMTVAYDESAKKLTIRGAETLSPEVIDRYIDHDIEILDASQGHLTSLPDNLSEMRNMRVAFFSNHDFESVPDVLARCENLELVGLRSCKIKEIGEHKFPANIKGIVLTDNEIEQLPASIGEYHALRKLMLSGNQLTTLPPELLQCENLQLIRLAANQLQESPEWLFTLPRLAWYADAGNPFHDSRPSDPLPVYPWGNIVFMEQIGKSANNSVHRAVLAEGQSVAVKLYGGGLSTDGLIDDEIAAYRQAGSHPQLIGATHETTAPSTGQRGLIMPLIPPHFSSLGLPPNLSTHTRDVMPPLARTRQSVRQTLRDIAEAMTHLHTRGVMHGDLYAHNILTGPTGASILGDLGAASRYSPDSLSLRERVDARAFGYLIDDLVSSGETPDPLLEQLREACLNKRTESIPRFRDLHSILESAQ